MTAVPVLLPLSDYPDVAALQDWWIHQDPSRGPLEVTDSEYAWQEDIASLPSDVIELLNFAAGWNWAVYPWLRSATMIPPEDITYAILTSRNYPVVSRTEQAKLKASYVIVVGLSTGRAVAQQIARLGVGRLLLVDGDHLAPSNSNGCGSSGVTSGGSG